MKHFFTGVLLTSISILGYQHFFSSEEQEKENKDTISVQFSDQVIEIPDTTKKDSVK